MRFVTRTIFIMAMVILGVVSMWTTYVSVRDSILPEPTVTVDLGIGEPWECSVFALALSVAIGLMLFALKMAIIDEQKRLNVLGMIGLTVVGFISISFNLDVLYRVADREFFIRYSNQKMRSVYEDYLTRLQADLIAKREAIQKIVARQEGELDAEIQGLREKPPGYGPVARYEDYQLTLKRKEAEVELIAVNEALAKKEEADTLLRTTLPQSLEEIDRLQNELRVILKDMGAVSGVSLPEVVKMDSPLFAVFSKLFEWRTIGIKEVFFVLLALLLDLGDILGYSLVPDKPRSRRASLEFLEDLDKPDLVFPSPRAKKPALASPEALPEAPPDPALPEAAAQAAGPEQPRRPFYFRRRP